LPNIPQNVFKKMTIFQKVNHSGASPDPQRELFIDSIGFIQVNPNPNRSCWDSKMGLISTAIPD
jgi:hypothetical protein